MTIFFKNRIKNDLQWLLKEHKKWYTYMFQWDLLKESVFSSFEMLYHKHINPNIKKECLNKMKKVFLNKINKEKERKKKLGRFLICRRYEGETISMKKMMLYLHIKKMFIGSKKNKTVLIYPSGGPRSWKDYNFLIK